MLRMLIGELIYEVGTSAFEVGVENGPERVMETDSGECTRLAVIQEDGETTTTATDQLWFDRHKDQWMECMDVRTLFLFEVGTKVHLVLLVSSKARGPRAIPGERSRPSPETRSGYCE